MNEIRKTMELSTEFDGELGVWMAALDELRQSTKQTVAGLSAAQLQLKPIEGGNSIGQLLRHIAIVELDWILNDISRGEGMPSEAPALTKLDGAMADPGPRPLQEFMEAFDYARTQTRLRIRAYKSKECDALREDVTHDRRRTFNVRWILFHLLDHEAHHKGQIGLLRKMLQTPK